MSRAFPLSLVALMACVGNSGGKLPQYSESGVEAFAAPVVHIDVPSAGGSWYADASVALSATVSDSDSPLGTLTFSWSSSLAGVLDIATHLDDQGTITGSLQLPAGDQQFRLDVVDETGAAGFDEVSVSVRPENAAPTCEIYVVATRGASVDTVAFVGTVADADEAVTGLSVEWSSSLAGVLAETPVDTDGSVRIIIDALPTGTQEVSLLVRDRQGGECVASTTYTVGARPSVLIATPFDGAVVNEGEEVVFEGVVSDADDPADRLSATWSSDRDGVLATIIPAADGSVGLSTLLSSGTHLLSLSVVDSDGDTASEAVSLRVNAIPTAPVISLSPDPAGTDDDLTVDFVAAGADADGDTLSYRYAWFVDGVVSAASVTGTMPATATTRGETWLVEVTATDGLATAPVASAELTIRNTPPTVATAAITPIPALRNDELTCNGIGFSDADGDADHSTYGWSVSGAVVASGQRLTNVYAVGTMITCTVTPFDGADAGSAVAASVVVENSAPQITDLFLSPLAPRTSDTIIAETTNTDAEGDAISLAYLWTVNGVSVAETGSSLDGNTYFDKGDTVSVSVQPSDAYSDGSTVVSGALTVANTPPTAVAVSITPASPDAGDDLVCTVDTAPSDADGDSVSLGVAWELDGAAYLAAVTTALSGDTVPGSDVDSGKAFVCLVTPDDGDDFGTTSSASVTVSTPETTQLGDVFADVNPNGAWRWGWTDSPGNGVFHAMDAYAVDEENALEMWTDSAVGAQPAFTKNPTAGDVTAGTVVWAAGGIGFTPGSGGEVATLRYSVPADGECSATVEFAAIDCCTTTSVGVYLSGASLGGGVLTTGGDAASGSVATFPVAAGDSLDFTVDGQGDATSDTTGLSGVLTCVF